MACYNQKVKVNLIIKAHVTLAYVDNSRNIFLDVRRNVHMHKYVCHAPHAPLKMHTGLSNPENTTRSK